MIHPIPPLFVVNYRSKITGVERLGSVAHESREDAEAAASRRTLVPEHERIVRAYVPLDEANKLADRAQAMVSSLELEVISLREEIANLRLARAEIRQAMDEARAAASSLS